MILNCAEISGQVRSRECGGGRIAPATVSRGQLPLRHDDPPRRSCRRLRSPVGPAPSPLPAHDSRNAARKFEYFGRNCKYLNRIAND